MHNILWANECSIKNSRPVGSATRRLVPVAAVKSEQHVDTGRREVSIGAESKTGKMQEAERPKTRHRIEIKVTEAQKELITQGAAAVRQGISEFVREAAERAAAEALKRP